MPRQVCDFGIAKFKTNTFLTTKHVQAGTPAYMAPGARMCAMRCDYHSSSCADVGRTCAAPPELFSGGAVNEKCDLWSFATLIWEMHTGEVPWKALVLPVQARVVFLQASMRACEARTCPAPRRG